MAERASEIVSRCMIRDLSKYEELYKHFHRHPELSNAERETCDRIHKELSVWSGLELHTGIGGHSIVGVLKNGDGPTVLLRADTDALPIQETTELTYKSTVSSSLEGTNKAAMHACGHDMHMTCLLAATEVLAIRARDHWSGTLVVLFQPAEERGTGAQAMVDDGLWGKIPRPDYLFGQHVVANLPAGVLGLRNGVIMTGAHSMRCTVYGRGGHASQPHRAIDAGLLASNCIVHLHQVVSREVAPGDTAVLTAVPLSAGVAENIIPDSIEIGVDTRFIKPDTGDHLQRCVRRIIDGECRASNATRPPTFVTTRKFPLTVNDPKLTRFVKAGFSQRFGQRFRPEIAVSTIAEDFPNLAQGKPYVFWHLGCSDGTRYDLDGRPGAKLPPVAMNHSSDFAPLIQPTLQVGTEALVMAALIGFKTPVNAHL